MALRLCNSLTCVVLSEALQLRCQRHLAILAHGLDAALPRLVSLHLTIAARYGADKARCTVN